ncbi:MFS transporter [Actinomadura rudentiformis]|uniref:MFS transporter n=1 Tax=Actinomadura rudentiformis TaxID=359158 RepID=A0A6H9YWZ5_9ACTN|nr:MFS transporter [Actinomadura rudentiformis]KAB2346372.1 MFS transporter [Actinomadura rudentiformis]
MTKVDVHTAPVTGPGAPPVARTRAMLALCSGSAMMNAAMAASSATSTLVAGDRLGAGWGGVPNTAGIVGTGVGALALTALMNRRTALIVGYVVAALGACLGVVAVASDDVLGLSLGMLLLGLGNAGAQLSRYGAAELYPPGRRGTAISIVVWSAAIGAVGGPLLMDPSGNVADGLGLVPFAGPFLLAAVTCVIAAVTSFRAPAGEVAPSSMTLRSLMRTSTARSALVVMATAQVVMVAVMTAAPLHMHLHGHGLASVGVALSTHTLGMFALSPITGRLLDRFGPPPVILAGLLTLAASCALAALGPNGAQLPALFLLGYAWNLCFVGGSARLARDVPAADRPHVEGAVDAAVWMFAAAASLLSTIVLSAGGYRVLAAGACVFALLIAAISAPRRNGQSAPKDGRPAVAP